MGGWTRLWIALSCAWIAFTWYDMDFGARYPISLLPDESAERPAMRHAMEATADDAVEPEKPSAEEPDQQWEFIKEQMAVKQRECYTLVEGPNPIELAFIGMKPSDIKCSITRSALADFLYRCVALPLLLLIVGFAAGWVRTGFRNA